MLMLALGFSYVATLIQGLESTMQDRLQDRAACPPSQAKEGQSNVDAADDSEDEDLVKSRTKVASPVACPQPKACDVCVACKPCAAVPDAAAAKAAALLELERAHKRRAEVRRGLYKAKLQYVQFSTWLYRPTWYVV
jgi:hypothetical protein